MKKAYEMVTLKNYVDTYLSDDVKYVDLTENEIKKQLEIYLIRQKRNETNAKTIESLLG